MIRPNFKFRLNSDSIAPGIYFIIVNSSNYNGLVPSFLIIKHVSQALPKHCKNSKFAQNIEMQNLLTDNMDKIKALCVAHNVKSLFAFGSVCTDRFNDKSDIDLLISFKPMDYGDYADTYFILADKFENLFKRKVDLVTDKSLSNPYFIDSIDQTKTLIYGA